MIDKKKLNNLRMHSENLKASAMWVNSLVNNFIKKTEDFESFFHPEDNLKEAFVEACLKDVEGVKNILEELGVLVERRSVEEYNKWQKDLYGEKGGEDIMMVLKKEDFNGQKGHKNKEH